METAVLPIANFIKAVIVSAIFAVTSVNSHSSNLCLIGDFDQQVNDLLQFVMLSEEELQSMRGLVADLETTLRARWPGCKVYPFGSTVSGLGIKSSDVDVYVELQNLTQAPRRTIVIEAQRIFEQQPDLYKVFEVRPTARVPIVTFVHIPTGTHCDVNFHSSSGIQNSQLSGFLLRSDKRALQLAVLIKFWASIHKILGSGRMSSYAMSLLVIFFLQQRHVLPSIASLQELGDVGITQNSNTVLNTTSHAPRNNESLYELMGGFFKYYSRFDFEQYVISTFVGQRLHRQLFKDVETIPEVFLPYRNNARSNVFQSLDRGFVVVQDMFEHNANVGKTVSSSLARDMMYHFQLAAKMYEHLSSQHFLKAILMEDNEPEVTMKEKNSWFGGVSTMKECIKFAKSVIKGHILEYFTVL